MEIISQLETALLSLAEEIKGLRSENSKLRNELDAFLADNERLETQLKEKEDIIANASSSIENLLSAVRSDLSTNNDNEE